MDQIMDQIPDEIWLHIISYLGNSKYDFYFTQVKFFEFIRYKKIGRNIIYQVIKKGLVDVFKYINAQYQKSNELIVNNKSFMQKSVNKYLSIASRYGQLNMVKYLIKLGACIHKRNDYALRVACLKGHLNVVEYLINQDAIINARNGESLILASKYGHPSVVDYLAKFSTDNEYYRNRSCRLACLYGHLNVVKYWIDSGINIDSDYGDYINLAYMNNRHEIVRYLESIGMKLNIFQDTKIYHHVSSSHGKIIDACTANSNIKAANKFFTFMQKYSDEINNSVIIYVRYKKILYTCTREKI
ncbi:ankyrin repeat protein [Bandra megavirus]|uniref:Ankyrin repeat protein n=1 Tax=Bandra megavirus TaxID=2071566 RepID=A0A2K9V730_9VIRU|nr:ankyrin repeat protein [Bandra megavirus]